MRDIIVIGGGHNGLVAAAFLAKAGLQVTVLERSDRTGGCARTSEIAPGFHCPTLAHTASIDPAIVRALTLERHGLQILQPDADACSPADGRALVLWRDRLHAAREIGAFSAKDAESFPRFLDSFARIGRMLETVCGAVPPSIDEPSAGDLLEMIRAGRAFRSLGKADAHRLLRWMPMPVADLVGEWFESDPLRAAVAGGGVLGAFLGPRSAGSSALLLWLGAATGHPVATGWPARGGLGAVGRALSAAAQQAGVEIRTGTEVVGITTTGRTATGVVLSTGDQLASRAVVSNLDPKRTLLGLVDPARLEPSFLGRVQHIRAHGTLAKVNYATGALPRFTGLAGRGIEEEKAALSGRVRLAPDVDSIERAFDAAKYGRLSDEPWIELMVPSVGDPSLVPAGRHVVSAYVQYAPYHLRGRTWDQERSRLGDAATAIIERHAPGFSASIIARDIVTPLDLERDYGLTGGHIFHGELALDQLFMARPLLGWARYTTPIRNLYLCGAGAHPGNGLTGRTGVLAAKAVARALGR